MLYSLQQKKSPNPPLSVTSLCHVSPLTEEDDDAEQDGNDGAGAQAGGNEELLIGAVPVLITLTHLHAQVGRVGHGQVAGVGDGDGDLVDASLEEADP